MKSFSDFKVLAIQSFYIITSSTVTLAIISPILLQMMLLSSVVADEQRAFPLNPKHGKVEIIWTPTQSGTRRKELDELIRFKSDEEVMKLEVENQKREMVFPRQFQLDYLMYTP